MSKNKGQWDPAPHPHVVTSLPVLLHQEGLGTDWRAHKAHSVYSLALHRKSLLTSDLDLSVTHCHS